MKDLFGNVVTEDEARTLLRAARKRKDPQPKGYAAIPGSGPDGETCKTCRHLTRRRHSRTYLKCGLMRARWTGGRGSDVLARSPACKRWEASA